MLNNQAAAFSSKRDALYSWFQRPDRGQDRAEGRRAIDNGQVCDAVDDSVTLAPTSDDNENDEHMLQQFEIFEGECMSEGEGQGQLQLHTTALDDDLFWPRSETVGDVLKMAASSGNDDVIATLLTSPRHIRLLDNCQLTEALCEACRHGQLTAVQLLIANGNLDLGAAVVAVETLTVGTLALAEACKGGHVDVVKHLVTIQKVGLNAPADDRGRTPLAIACRMGSWRVARWLLSFKRQTDDVTTYEGWKHMPLSLAERTGYLHKVRWMLEAGTQLPNPSSSSFSSISSSQSNGSIVESLNPIKQLSLKADGRYANLAKLTNLTTVYRQMRASVSQYLLDIFSDVDVNLADSSGNTPLHYVISSCRISSPDSDLACPAAGQASHLLKSSSLPTATLHEACYAGDKQRVLDFIFTRDDLDLNEQNGDGDTALHVACRRGHGDLVEMLMLAGADEMVSNDDGDTPAAVAIGVGRQDLLDLLDRDFLSRTVLRRTRRRVFEKSVRLFGIIVTLVRETELRRYRLAIQSLRAVHASNPWIQNIQRRIDRHRVVRYVLPYTALFN